MVVIVERSSLVGLAARLETLWDRDILAFFLIGMMLFGLGLLGEYVGRIYQQVRERPRYVIRRPERARDPDIAEPSARDAARPRRRGCRLRWTRASPSPRP